MSTENNPATTDDEEPDDTLVIIANVRGAIEHLLDRETVAGYGAEDELEQALSRRSRCVAPPRQVNNIKAHSPHGGWAFFYAVVTMN